jgi:hypothetical protein
MHIIIICMHMYVQCHNTHIYTFLNNAALTYINVHAHACKQ